MSEGLVMGIPLMLGNPFLCHMAEWGGDWPLEQTQE